MECQRCGGETWEPRGSFTVRYPDIPEQGEVSQQVMSCGQCGKLRCEPAKESRR